MFEMSVILKNTLALFAIVNPISSIPIFLSIIKSNNLCEKSAKGLAAYATTTALIVLAGASFFGDHILKFFSISIYSFTIGAGIVLLGMALSMLKDNDNKNSNDNKPIQDYRSMGVVPLGIPILAGAGAISSVIVWAYNLNFTYLSLSYRLLPILIVCIVSYFVFILSTNIFKFLGQIGVNIITRLMGILLTAVAIEMIIQGLLKSFPGLQ